MNYIFLITVLLSINSLNNIENNKENKSAIKHDIILIQGEPRLATMTTTGKVISDYPIYGDYFGSNLSHDEFIEGELGRSGDLMKTRYISFQALLPELDESAADHIRYISVLAEDNANADIVITTNNSDLGQSVSKEVHVLLRDFGITNDRIKHQFKEYVGNTEDHFIRVALQPRISG